MEGSSSCGKTKEGVPTWDGGSESFQAYVEAAQLYEQAVPYHKRYLCGPKLQAELVGAARRLVVGQRPDWISYAGGVDALLSHLRKCLGKPQMPELTELLAKYFKGTRRRAGESMGEFITRKCETYLRAQQAMQRLQGHHDGQGTLRKEGHYGYGRPWNYDYYYNNRRGSLGSWASEATLAASPGDEEEDSEVQAAAPTEASPPSTSASTTQASSTARSDDYYYSWWGNQGWWSWNGPYRWQRPDDWSSSWSNAGSNGSEESRSLPELLPDWVQAWYLLQDASLEPSERNLVITAIQGQMTLQRVAQELRSQFPDSDLRKRDSHRKHQSYLGEHLDSGDEATENGELNFAAIEELTEEGYAAWSEAKDEAEAALAAIQSSRRTLRAARERQHQVKLSRQYYRGSSSGQARDSGPRDDSGITCLRCGVKGHRAANCPAQKPQPKTEPESAPFVCYATEPGSEQAYHSTDSSSPPTTMEAVGQGKCVLDCGATKSLGSVYALEQIMRLSNQGIASVDRNNRPSFSFGNSTENRCLSTVHLKVSAGGQPGVLRVHALDQGRGPVLLSVEALKALKATVDFEHNLMILRGVNDRKLIPLEQARSGHLLLPLTEDLFSKALDANVAVPSLSSYVREMPTPPGVE